MNQDNSHYDAFIFTHIPKCGGTSLRYFLNESAKQSGVPRRKRYIPGFNWLSVEKDYHRLNKVKQAIFLNRSYKVIAMHVEYGWHLNAAPYMKSPFYYTMLRNPLDRVISHYQFFNKGKGRRGVKGIDIRELDKTKLDEVLSTSANLSVQYVIGRGINGGKVTSMMMDDALDNLMNKYHAYGILEESEKSINSLMSNWPNWLSSTLTLEHKNKSAIKGVIDVLSKDIIDRITEDNRFEIEFYDIAKNIFNQRGQNNNRGADSDEHSKISV